MFQWSRWLQSPANLEHMEEPELPYDFDDMGAMMSFAKMVQSPSSQTLVAQDMVMVPSEFNGKASQEIEFGTHFQTLMGTPLDQWLAPAVSAGAKKRVDRVGT